MGNSLSPLQKEAPQLTKYFKHQAKFHKDVAGMVGNPMELMTNPAKAQKLAEKMQRMQKALDDKLTVKARKSFKHHDVDDSGELDEAESQIFFEHYTRLYLEYTKDNGVEAAKTESVQLMQVAKLMGEGKGLSVKEEAIAAPLIKIKKEIEAQCEEYLQDKEARNKKAFAVIDVNGDGKLQEQEVVDALTPGHAKNIDLREALGLLSKQEKLQRKMQETARKKQVMRANGDVEGLKKLEEEELELVGNQVDDALEQMEQGCAQQ